MNSRDNWKAQQAARDVAAKALQATHKHLVGVDRSVRGRDDLVCAAKNIRIELAAAFPGTKFYVRSSRYAGGDSIRVIWLRGPQQAQVDEIVRKYRGGSFDGMTDMFNPQRSAWTDAFGSADYVSVQREEDQKWIA